VANAVRHQLPEGCRAAPDRAQWLAARYSAAVVIPCSSPSSGWWTGPGSVAEAEAFIAAGKDAHVLFGSLLVPWQEIHAEETGELAARQARPVPGC
jgi:hypothetical protein